jgi:S-DNA-T family DNA segregation ATPase FtsK/SpoIIIE
MTKNDAHWIELQATWIETTLARYGLADIKVTGGTVTPRFVSYQLTLPPSQTQTLVCLATDIARDLGVPACRVCSGNDSVHIEVPRNGVGAPRLTALCKRLAREGPRGQNTVPPVTAVLGLSLSGEPLLLRLPSPNVSHVLIAGNPGASKTALARTIVASLALQNHPNQMQIALVGEELQRAFAGLPHLAKFAGKAPNTTILDTIAATAIHNAVAARQITPYLVLVIDDLDQLPPAEQAMLSTVLEKGPAVGVHVVATVTNPSAMHQNASLFPIHLLGQGAEPATEATPLFGQGDFLVMARGQTTRLQVAYIDETEMQTTYTFKEED